MQIKFSNGFVIDSVSISELVGNYDDAPVEGLSDPEETVLNIAITDNNVNLQQMRNKITSETVNIIEIDNGDSIILYEGFSIVKSITRNIANNSIVITLIISGKNIESSVKDKN